MMTCTTYTSTQTAKLIRLELKTNFPKQKFSVTSSRHEVRINWEDGVSSREVRAVTDKFGGIEFDGMQDLNIYNKTEYKGELVQFYCYKPYLRRSYTKTFAEKVIAKALLIKPYLHLAAIYSGYDNTYSIDYTDGYNGITRHHYAEIIDKISEANIDDPIEVEEVPIPPEPRIVDPPPPIQPPIVPIAIEPMNEAPGAGLFPSSNKQHTLDDYIRQEQPEPTDVRITDRVQLSNENYDIFTQNLTIGRDWLIGKGGVGSTTAPAGKWQNYSPADWDNFRIGSYLLVVEVLADDRAAIYVDPQGGNYAKYVGFPTSMPDPAPAELLLEDVGLRPQYSNWVRSQIDRGSIGEIVAYEQWAAQIVPTLYQEWVQSLLAQGAIEQIVSLEDWVQSIV
jgi:hypothetical protein